MNAHKGEEENNEMHTLEKQRKKLSDQVQSNR